MGKKTIAGIVYKTTDSSDKPMLIGVTDSIEKAECLLSHVVYSEAKRIYEESQPEISYWGPDFIEVSAREGDATSFSIESGFVESGKYVYLLVTEDHREPGVSDITLFRSEDDAYSYFMRIKGKKGEFEDLEDEAILELDLGDRKKGILPQARFDEGEGSVDLYVLRERIGGDILPEGRIRAKVWKAENDPMYPEAEPLSEAEIGGLPSEDDLGLELSAVSPLEDAACFSFKGIPADVRIGGKPADSATFWASKTVKAFWEEAEWKIRLTVAADGALYESSRASKVSGKTFGEALEAFKDGLTRDGLHLVNGKETGEAPYIGRKE